MKLPRVRFTVRRMLVAVAIIAVNLAAVAAVLREKDRPVGGGIGGGSPTMTWHYERHPDGSYWRITRDTLAGVMTDRTMVQPPKMLGVFLVWWPLGASLGISLMVLLRASRRHWLSVAPDPPEHE